VRLLVTNRSAQAHNNNRRQDQAMKDKTEYQLRIDFYKAKMASYVRRYPAALPSRSTFRRWARECNKQLHERAER